MEKKYFGVMLDMSRNAVMRVSEVKAMVDYLVKMGYNMLMLYTEDTYEVDNEPYFGYLRGRYSKEEIKEIDAYCISKGVELIPCVQTLAHVNSIFKWWEYKPIRDVADILLIEEERTYRLIDNMLSTLRECFSSKKIHIGMDEAHLLGLGKYLDKHGYKNRFEILYGHLTKVVKMCDEHDFQPMMWSDMFFRLANNGAYTCKHPVVEESVKEGIPEGLQLVFWNYYEKEKQTYVNMLKAHKKMSDEPIWFAGGAWTWCGFAPLNRFSMLTTNKALSACREQGVDNVIITMWGDNGKETSFYSVLPSLFYSRCIYDGITSMKEIKQKFYAVTGERFDDFLLLDEINNINDEARAIKQVNAAKYIFYNDILLGFMDSRIKPDIEKTCKSIAKRLRVAAKRSANFSYLFEEMAALADALSYKCNLGQDLRAAYKAGDKETIKALCDKIAKFIKKTQVFHDKFRYLWNRENKPHGFDVQDLRIGGVILRAQSVKARLESYLHGEIDVIEELEEEILDYCSPYEVIADKDIYLNLFSESTTVNIL